MHIFSGEAANDFYYYLWGGEAEESVSILIQNTHPLYNENQMQEGYWFPTIAPASPHL